MAGIAPCNSDGILQLHVVSILNVPYVHQAANMAPMYF